MSKRILPEGFFDDSRKESKTLKAIQKKSTHQVPVATTSQIQQQQLDEEWDAFQKEINIEVKKSNQLQKEDEFQSEMQREKEQELYQSSLKLKIESLKQKRKDAKHKDTSSLLVGDYSSDSDPEESKSKSKSSDDELSSGEEDDLFDDWRSRQSGKMKNKIRNLKT